MDEVDPLAITVFSTLDINLVTLRESFLDIASFDFQIDDSQTGNRSVGEVSSWIQFTATFSDWIKIALGVSGVTLTSVITKDLYELAKRIVNSKLNSSKHTKIFLTVPFPDERHQCLLEIKGDEPTVVAEQILAFSNVIGQIQQKLLEAEFEDKDLATPITINIEGNTVSLKWVEFPILREEVLVFKV